MKNKILQGDCLIELKKLKENSIDSVVTDPPYGLEFMGKEFDTFKGNGIDPAFCHWFAGFTDGEGCFSVHKKPHNTFDCQFSIQLRGDDKPILERVKKELGIGTLRPAKDGRQARYCVSSQGDCLILRDIFRSFPLRAKKALDFEIWSDALDKWLAHKIGEWGEMEKERDKLMASREFKPEGIRIDPFQLWTTRWAKEVCRVLEPGGYLLSFGGTRTYHRMACAIEDAGFEIRDMVEYIYGSGFPKSLNIPVSAEKRLCFYDKKANQWKYNDTKKPMQTEPPFRFENGYFNEYFGWGTATKPAHEPICMARKPLSEKTVAENVLKYGTGGINIDGCRIETDNNDKNLRVNPVKRGIQNGNTFQSIVNKRYKVPRTFNKTGRFPANLIHDGSKEVVDMFPNTKSGGGNKNSKNSKAFFGNMESKKEYDSNFEPNEGSAARFFYCAKASKAERNRGCEGLGDKQIPYQDYRKNVASTKSYVSEYPNGKPRPMNINKNNHPTVKPLALMRYLINLVTPPKGTVLDPFAGSGSTLVAAKELGFKFIGIEKEEEYIKIAEARIKAVKDKLI